MLSTNKKMKYIANRGLRCPHCGSADISGGPFDCDETGAWQEITCRACDKEWTDIYTLADVEE
jgi:hypothetical protein